MSKYHQSTDYKQVIYDEEGLIICSCRDNKRAAEVCQILNAHDALKEQVEKLKRELLERGGHGSGCAKESAHSHEEQQTPCTCGWQARREKLEEELKKGE